MQTFKPKIKRDDSKESKSNTGTAANYLTDNRPESVSQLKLKDSLIAGSGIIQRTTYKHDGTNWQVIGFNPTDTDKFQHPGKAYPFALKDDIYDQNTGYYHSPMRAALTSIGKSTGPMGFYDKRSATGFKYASGKNQQGPHTLAHVTKRVAMTAAMKVGRNPLNLRGSSAFPRPRVMNKMLRDRLRLRGPKWQNSTRQLRTQYLKTYIKHWKESKNHPTVAGRLQALRRGIELNPATVYNISTGKVTSAQIGGKGENRMQSAADMLKLVASQGPVAGVSLSTMDLSGATPMEQSSALRMTTSFRSLLQHDDVDEDSGDSSSDSLMELDDDNETYGLK